MNTIQQFTPNYYQNRTLRADRQNIQFRGELGKKVIGQITRETNIPPFVARIIDDIKGTFGTISKDKLKDVFESCFGEIQSLRKEVNRLNVKSSNAENRINAFPEEKQKAVDEARRAMRDSYQTMLQAKNEEISGLKSEIERLKIFEDMAKVKSVEEIGVVMPDRAIEVMNEMVKQKVPARKSMAEFLFSGDASKLTEARTYLEFNAEICKAQQDGVISIPSVSKVEENLRNNERLYFAGPSTMTLNLIQEALESSPKGEYLASAAMRRQVTQNAFSILKPMADERYYGEGVNDLSKKLEEALTRADNYHKYFAKAKARIASMTGEAKSGKRFASVEYKPVEFDPLKSKVVLTENDGRTFEMNYYEFCQMRDAI